MNLFLTLLSGIGWMIVYEECIRLGFRDKSYAMPLKWIGTLAPTILMGVISYNPLVLCCGVFCSVFDLIYIWLLMRHKQRQNCH